MYIAIKELSGHNGFLVEYRINKAGDPDRWRTEIQKFFPTREAVANGLPAILSEAV